MAPFYFSGVCVKHVTLTQLWSLNSWAWTSRFIITFRQVTKWNLFFHASWLYVPQELLIFYENVDSNEWLFQITCRSSLFSLPAALEARSNVIYGGQSIMLTLKLTNACLLAVQQVSHFCRVNVTTLMVHYMGFWSGHRVVHRTTKTGGQIDDHKYSTRMLLLLYPCTLNYSFSEEDWA